MKYMDHALWNHGMHFIESLTKEGCTWSLSPLALLTYTPHHLQMFVTMPLVSYILPADAIKYRHTWSLLDSSCQEHVSYEASHGGGGAVVGGGSNIYRGQVGFNVKGLQQTPLVPVHIHGWGREKKEPPPFPLYPWSQGALVSYLWPVGAIKYKHTWTLVSGMCFLRLMLISSDRYFSYWVLIYSTIGSQLKLIKHHSR